MSRVRIVVAHSQRLILEGLCALMKYGQEIEVAWQGSSSEAALEAVFRLAPTAALVELEMPRLTGLELARRMKVAGSRTQLILLGERRGPALTQAVESAGAHCYLPTDVPAELMLEAIRAAGEGRPFTAAARTSAPEWKDRVGLEALSAREVDVLRALAAGLSSREIAEQLSLSFRTVDGYRASLMDKLFIRTVPGLVKFAIRHRLTELDR